MASTRTYELTTTNKRRTNAELRRPDSTHATFELDLSFCTADWSSTNGKHSIVMRGSKPKTATSGPPPILGTCDITFKSLSIPIHLCFGDPDSSSTSAVWEDLVCRNKRMTTGFELNIELGGNLGRRVFDWKRTHDVQGAGAVAQKVDWLNLKMVDRESGDVVARFVHHPWYGSKKGVFEIEDFEGVEEWDRIVVLSGSAVLEYMRKISGWSW